MKYPKKANWVTVCQREDGFHIIDNLSDCDWIVDEALAFYLDNYFDGKKNPYSARGYTKQYMKNAVAFFKEEELIRTNRTLLKEHGTIYRTVFSFEKNETISAVSKWINLFLQLVWLPLSIISIIISSKWYNVSGDMYFFYIGMAIGLLFGLFFHEVGHIVAALTYSCNVYEAGWMIDDFLPGAYVLTDNHANKISFEQQIQIDAAGIEVNCFLMSLCLIIGPFTPIPLLFYGAALSNFLLGTENLLLLKEGSDGEQMLSRLLSVKSIAAQSVFIMHHHRLRNKIKKYGTIGKVTLLFLFVIDINQNEIYFTIKSIAIGIILGRLFQILTLA